MNKHLKVAVTGAAGQIGYAFLFRLASGGVFGHNVSLDLHLLEVEAALPGLQGVVMELVDCAFPLLKNIKVTSLADEGMKDVNYAVLIGSMPRKAGMERSDLLKINGAIFTTQGKAINNHAANDVRIFVVGNPCNTNCLIAMHNAPDVPKDRFYAMSMLDQNRAASQLALKAGADLCQVSNINIWGNHSSTQYPDFYNAQINGKFVPEVIHDQHWLQQEFIPLIQQRGAEVIKARGGFSSAASAANGIVDSLRALTTDTPANQSFSICRCSQGEYDVDEGLIFSFPCRTQNGKVSVVMGRKHNAFALEKIDLTLNELRRERDAVRDLGLIE